MSAHPGKARDLLAYLATLLAGAEKGDWWRAYDSRFRQQIPALESAEFGKLDQALYTRSIFILVLLAVASMEAPLFRQRAGATTSEEAQGGAMLHVERREALCGVSLLLLSRVLQVWR